MTDTRAVMQQALHILERDSASLLACHQDPKTGAIPAEEVEVIAMFDEYVAAITALRAALEAHVGDSDFEGWFAQYSPAGKSDKQRARDAYTAGVSGRAALEAPQAEPVAWAIFTPAGNVRLWAKKQEHLQRLADAEGLTLTPLYAAPQPANVADLLAELDGERNRSQMFADLVRGVAVALHGEGWSDTSKLPEEVEALRADAERYRLLRRGQRWSIINGIGDELRAETLDAAIDAAKGGA